MEMCKWIAKWSDHGNNLEERREEIFKIEIVE